MRGTLTDNAQGSGGASDDPSGYGAVPGVVVPSDSWPGARAQPDTTPARQPTPARSISPEYRPAAVDPGYPTEIPAVDPAYDGQWDAKHQGEDYYGDTASDWPDDAQYAPEDYDSYDESYDDDPDYDRGEPASASGLDALRRKLRPWHAIAAVAALAIVSIGWSFLHRAGVDGSREIATIEAPEGPMKVKPTIEPEAEAPTAGAAAVLDRNEPEAVRKVVKNLEQAVDPSVAPQQGDAAVPDSAPSAEVPGTVQLGAGRVDAPHEPPPASRVQQPRKVKSIAVPAIPVAQPAGPAIAALPQPAAPATAKPATGGTYSAQFAAANSEAEARTLIKSLSGKYGGALVGGKFTFKPVKTGDKTVYRVRVGGITREAAEAVCAKAKSGGDACSAVGN